MTSILAKMQDNDFWNKFKNKYKWMTMMNDYLLIKCYFMEMIELIEKLLK